MPCLPSSTAKPEIRIYYSCYNRPCEDTITLTAEWENYPAREGGKTTKGDLMPPGWRYDNDNDTSDDDNMQNMPGRLAILAFHRKSSNPSLAFSGNSRSRRPCQPSIELLSARAAKKGKTTKGEEADALNWFG